MMDRDEDLEQEQEPEEDDDFFCVEARGRCYTWPVNQIPLTVGGNTTTLIGNAIHQKPSTPAFAFNAEIQPSFTQQSAPPQFYPGRPNRSFSSVDHFPTPIRNPLFFNASTSCGLNLRPLNCDPNGGVQPSTSLLSIPRDSLQQGCSLAVNFGTCSSSSSSVDQHTLFTKNYSPTKDSLDDKLSEKPKRIRKRNSGDNVSHKKPNPWGEESYSDLIARALSSALDGRLKLNEIYQWFSDNIPYFHERSSQEEAQGWKNSIRHNLSLHSRFMRIQNEGAGKSSWWVLNPDAKSGRNPRRRANTMESSAKAAIDKKKRNMCTTGSRKSSLRGAFGSTNEVFDEDDSNKPRIERSNVNFEAFRPRTQSALSIPCSSSRISPTLEPPGFEDFDLTWMDTETSQPQSNVHVKELLDKTDKMRIDMEDEFRRKLDGKTIKLERPSTPQNQPNQKSGGASRITIKTECPAEQNLMVQPPPSYQELTRADFQPSQNGLENGAKMGHPRESFGQFYSPNYGDMPPAMMVQARNQWMMVGGEQLQNIQVQEQQFIHQPTPQIFHSNQNSEPYGTGDLPRDLSNFPEFDQPLVTDSDMEILRHELSQSQGNQLQFDLP